VTSVAHHGEFSPDEREREHAASLAVVWRTSVVAV
jgi:hypothetical protein